MSVCVSVPSHSHLQSEQFWLERFCAESDSALSNSAGFAQRRFLESPMWHCSGRWTGVVPSAEMSSLNACEILWL